MKFVFVKNEFGSQLKSVQFQKLSGIDLSFFIIASEFALSILFTAYFASYIGPIYILFLGMGNPLQYPF